MRTARPLIILLCTLACLAACTSQEEEKPAVDRTDPVAVVNAYLAACQDTDVKTAISLIVEGDPLREHMEEFASEVARGMTQEAMSFDSILKEFSLMPMPFPLEAGAPVSEQTAEGATVTIPATLPLDRKFVLKKDEDGLWAIDLLESVKATTGREGSFLVMQRTGGGPGGPGGDRPYDCQNHLRILARALTDYADEHDQLLPEAATWMDDIDPYLLDKSVYKCPGAPDLEYAYAYNSEAAGKHVPNDWQERREFVLLFEWGSGERNAAVPAHQMATFEPRHGDTVHFIAADTNSRVAARGETPQAIFAEEAITETCEQRLRRICRAALAFAKDNEGRLPGADTWCDDLLVYLANDPDAADVFVCPVKPEFECGFAINSEVAGKNATEMVAHRRIVLFMESDLGHWNASAPVPEAAPEGRHRARWYSGRETRLGNHIGYLNGSVGLVGQGQSMVPTY
ncbi:MAG: hypothetical protein ACE5R4_13715 [Armatimonadota bacterium]